MISKNTATRIAYAYSDIEAANELLRVIAEAQERREETDFRDAFGRRRGLQLGVPSGANGHRIMDLSTNLAEIIIRAHIREKASEIEALCELARTEMMTAAGGDK